VEPSPPPAAEKPAPPESEAPRRALDALTIDPTFDAARLEDAETRAWYNKVKAEIRAERATPCPDEPKIVNDSGMIPTFAACTGLKSTVGRALNTYVTSLLTLFRITGDKELLDEVDRIMEKAREGLSDTNGDGYRNWVPDVGVPNDFNAKEDSLAHGFLAMVVYVLKKNARYSTPTHDYGAHAEAWLAYLRDDFEAKWRGRTDSGFPVHALMHPYINLLRYQLYMSKLFPEDPRYKEILREMTRVAFNEFRSDTTENGEAYVWSHRVRQTSSADENTCLYFQMSAYPPLTIQSFVDLALSGHAEFASEAALRKLARTLSESLLEPTEHGFVYKDVGGLRNGDLDPDTRKEVYIGPVGERWCFKESWNFDYGVKQPGFRNEKVYLLLPYTAPAAWAARPGEPLEDTKVYRMNLEVYGSPYGSSVGKHVHVPAAMAFMRLYHAGNYALSELASPHRYGRR